MSNFAFLDLFLRVPSDKKFGKAKLISKLKLIPICFGTKQDSKNFFSFRQRPQNLNYLTLTAKQIGSKKNLGSVYLYFKIKIGFNTKNL